MRLVVIKILRSRESRFRSTVLSSSTAVFIYTAAGTHDPVLGIFLLAIAMPLMKESEVCLLVLLTGQYKPCR